MLELIILILIVCAIFRPRPWRGGFFFHPHPHHHGPMGGPPPMGGPRGSMGPGGRGIFW